MKHSLAVINIKEYNDKIKLAFHGQGGCYVQDYYNDAIKDSQTLEDVVKGMIDNIDDIILTDRPYLKNYPKPINDEERMAFIETYMYDKCCFPELCGTIAGILFKNGKLEETLKFLEIDDMDEPRHWDS